MSQVAHETKEAIHISKLDPELNKNVGKMIILYVFYALLDVKPKNLHVSSIVSQGNMSQSLDIDLTQFHSLTDKRMRC